MRSRRPAEAFTVKSSGGSQQRSMWQSAEIISYRIARERSSAELARQAPRKRRAGDAGAAGILPLARARVASPATQLLLARSEEHTSELQSRLHLVCRLLLEKKINHSHGKGPASREPKQFGPYESARQSRQYATRATPASVCAPALSHHQHPTHEPLH